MWRVRTSTEDSNWSASTHVAPHFVNHSQEGHWRGSSKRPGAIELAHLSQNILALKPYLNRSPATGRVKQNGMTKTQRRQERDGRREHNYLATQGEKHETECPAGTCQPTHTGNVHYNGIAADGWVLRARISAFSVFRGEYVEFPHWNESRALAQEDAASASS